VIDNEKLTWGQNIVWGDNIVWADSDHVIDVRGNSNGNNIVWGDLTLSGAFAASQSMLTAVKYHTAGADVMTIACPRSAVSASAPFPRLVRLVCS
jgi:hypothetical protein